MQKVLQKTIKNFYKSNKLMLKTQQRFKSERHNVFIEDINKIDLSSNVDKIIQLIDSMWKKLNVATLQKMINFYDVTKENIIVNNTN